MNMSPTIGELAKALAKAQATFKPAVKDSNNPFFKSKYVALDGAIEAVREALTENGIAITQLTGYEGEKLILNSMLIHASGEWIGGTYPIKGIKDDPQGVGSAVTYARRYSLMALVGIAAEDDDGEAASGRGKQPAIEKVATVTGEVVKAKPKATPEEAKRGGELRAAFLRIGGEGYVGAVFKKMAYDTPADMIKVLETTINKWSIDQQLEATQFAEWFDQAEATPTLNQEAARWDWSVPADVLDAMEQLKKKCG